MNELDNYITLTDMNGHEQMFEFLDLVIHKDKEYVVLMKDEPDTHEVIILKIEEGDTPDTEIYTSIDDENTLETVYEIFKERNKDIYDFEG